MKDGVVLCLIVVVHVFNVCGVCASLVFLTMFIEMKQNITM